MWIPLKGGLELIKKLGGGKEGFKKALKQNRKLFKKRSLRRRIFHILAVFYVLGGGPISSPST